MYKLAGSIDPVLAGRGEISPSVIHVTPYSLKGDLDVAPHVLGPFLIGQFVTMVITVLR